MRQPYLTFRPSQIRSIIRQCMAINSTEELLSACKIVLGQETSEKKTDTELVFDDVPDELRPLAEALYGLVEATDEVDENPKAKIPAQFPLLTRKNI